MQRCGRAPRTRTCSTGRPASASTRSPRTFARSLLGTEREFHADLYELDALGEMIRIDAIRELRRDLHMRPFEADRRVYLIQRAHLLNEDAADALLKDLEEPPSYAVIVLIADDLGPLPETIRSRCQLVPFQPALGARDPRARRRARTAPRRRRAGGDGARRRGAARPARAAARSRPRAGGARRCSSRPARPTPTSSSTRPPPQPSSSRTRRRAAPRRGRSRRAGSPSSTSPRATRSSA